MEEIWKDIEGYEGLYKISNLGKVYSVIKNKLVNMWINSTGYYYVDLTKDKNRKHWRLHRLLAIHFVENNDPLKLIYVDHINRDRLDNRIENLRWVDMKSNNINTSKRKRSTSNYRGVMWFKRDSRWHSQITVKGEKIHLGYFNNEIDAAKAYDNEARKYKFYNLNFPD